MCVTPFTGVFKNPSERLTSQTRSIPSKPTTCNPPSGIWIRPQIVAFYCTSRTIPGSPLTPTPNIAWYTACLITNPRTTRTSISAYPPVADTYTTIITEGATTSIGALVITCTCRPAAIRTPCSCRSYAMNAVCVKRRYHKHG